MSRPSPRRRLAAVACLLTTAALLLAAPAAQAGINSWTLHGITTGGAQIYSLATHPTDGNIALASASGGLYRSTNGGLTWSASQGAFTDMPARSLAFDPSDPDRVLVADLVLLASTDAGASFAPVQASGLTGSAQRIAFGPDGTAYVLTYNSRLFRAVAPFTSWTELTVPWPVDSSQGAVATDPNDPLAVFVAVSQQGVYRSLDGGQTWDGPLTTGMLTPTTTFVNTLAVDPANSMRLLLATYDGIYLSGNRGDTWAHRNGGSTYWAGFDPEQPSLVVALQWQRVARSVNAGVDWTSTFAHYAYELANGAFIAGVPDAVLIGMSNGLASSADAAVSFTYQNSGLFGFQPAALAASNDGSVYAAMSIGTADVFQRSGNEFAPLPPLPDVTGLGRRLISELAVAAGDSRQIFAINGYSQLIRTFDRGVTWSPPQPDLMNDANDRPAVVVIDPSNPQIAYVARYQSGIWKTTNAGASFAQVSSTPVGVIALAVSPLDPSVLYAAGGPSPNTMGSGLYKSSDGGQTWIEQIAPAPLANRQFNGFNFHPTDPGTVYANAMFGGVYRTIDGGATWTPMFISAPGAVMGSASALLIDPSNPATLVVPYSSASGEGLMRSIDGGVEWRATPVDLPGPALSFLGAILDPLSPSRVITSTYYSGFAEYEFATDLDLSISALPSPMQATSAIRFTIANRGPHASSAADLVITTPPWLSVSGPRECARSGQTITCTLGAQYPDLPRTFMATLSPTGAGTGTLQASLLPHERDTDPANNVVSASLTAAALTDIDVEIASTTTHIPRGTSVPVTLTVRNSGPSASALTLVSFQVPAMMTATSLQTSRGDVCTAQLLGTVCVIGTLNASETATVTFDLRGDSLGAGMVTAAVNGAVTDTDGDIFDFRQFTVQPVADMSVTLTDSADPVTAGTAWQYVATLTHVNGDAGDFSVAIPVTGATISGVTSSFGACATTGQTVTCTSAALAANTAGTITINATSATAGSASATATLTYSGTDSNPANNTATQNTTITAAPSGSGSSSGGAASSGGKGGGGGLDWWLLGALGCGAFGRLARWRRAA